MHCIHYNNDYTQHNSKHFLISVFLGSLLLRNNSYILIITIVIPNNSIAFSYFSISSLGSLFLQNNSYIVCFISGGSISRHGPRGLQCLQHLPKSRTRIRLPKKFRNRGEDQQDQMVKEVQSSSFPALHQW